MHSLWEHRREMMSKLTAVILFLCAAGSIGYTYWTGAHSPYFGLSDWANLELIANAASPLVFLGACVLVFIRPRLGYVIGLIAGLLALPRFLQTEDGMNSWIGLNSAGAILPDEATKAITAFTKLIIASTILVVLATACASLRLLPVRWSLRGYPLLEKRGLRFRETRITAYRNGRVFIARSDRRLFQYRSEARVSMTGLTASPTAPMLARDMLQSPVLWKMRTPLPGLLRSWNAEGWYVALKDSRLLAFTSEFGTAPPAVVAELFHQIEHSPGSREHSFAIRDVSLGFGYDPVAALGFSIVEQRTKLLSLSGYGSAGGF